MEEVGEDNVEGDHDQDDNGVDYDSAVVMVMQERDQ